MKFSKRGAVAWLFVAAVLCFVTPGRAAETEKATFAGGCFWCMEHPFEELDGVSAAVSGYTGGHTENPTYEAVSGGTTGHVEAVEITFDPARVSYEKLLEVYWRQIDPTDQGGQFVDRGDSYRPLIFYHDETQKELAQMSKRALDASGRYPKPVNVPITSAGPFYRAEQYHQDYYNESPIRYKIYRYASGRDRYLDSIWDDK